jgi:ankyrin repeat protein
VFTALAANPFGQEIIEMLIKKKIALTYDFLKRCVFAATRKNNTDLVECLLKDRSAVDNEAILGLNIYNDNVLHIAIEKGNQSLVKLFIEKGIDVNAPKKDANTPLHLAAEKGQIETVKVLLEKEEIKVNEENHAGFAPLHLASQLGHADIVEMLLEKQANVDITLPNGSTSLYLAAEQGHVPIIRKLLDNGADISRTLTKFGMTPLHAAGSRGRGEAAQELISRGARIDATAKYSKTAFLLAVENKHIKVVQLFIDKGANVNVKSEYGNTALHFAVENGDLEMVEQLLKYPKTDRNCVSSEGKTPLDIACEKNELDVAKALIKAGAKRKVANRLLFPISSIQAYFKSVSPEIVAAEKGFKYCNKAAKHIARTVIKDTKKAGLKDLQLYIRNALLDAYDFNADDLMKDLDIKNISDFDGAWTMSNNKNIQTLAKAIKDSLPLPKKAFEKVIEGLSKREGLKDVLNNREASLMRA